MFDTYLIKYGEIGIKGKNRHVFEDALAKQIRLALAKIPGEFTVRELAETIIRITAACVRHRRDLSRPHV